MVTVNDYHLFPSMAMILLVINSPKSWLMKIGSASFFVANEVISEVISRVI